MVKDQLVRLNDGSDLKTYLYTRGLGPDVMSVALYCPIIYLLVEDERTVSNNPTGH